MSWKRRAIDAYHLLTLAEGFRTPPAFFEWPSGYVQAVVDELREAVQAGGHDMYILEAHTYLQPRCDKCGLFECVIGIDCCEGALTAGATWEKERPRDHRDGAGMAVVTGAENRELATDE